MTISEGIFSWMKDGQCSMYKEPTEMDFETFLEDIQNNLASNPPTPPVMYMSENMFRLNEAYLKNDQEEIDRITTKMKSEYYITLLGKAKYHKIDYDIYYLLDKIDRDSNGSWTLESNIIWDKEDEKWCGEKGYDYEPSDYNVLELTHDKGIWTLRNYISLEGGYCGIEELSEKQITEKEVFELILK